MKQTLLKKQIFHKDTLGKKKLINSEKKIN
jgi:hypothetical protein